MGSWLWRQTDSRIESCLEPLLDELAVDAGRTMVGEPGKGRLRSNWGAIVEHLVGWLGGWLGV